MEAVEEVGGDDVWGDCCLKCGVVVVGGCNYAVVKIVVSEGLYCCFIENQSRESCVVDVEMGGGGDSYLIIAAVDKDKVKAEVDCRVVSFEVDVVHEWQEDIFVGSVKGDSS